MSEEFVVYDLPSTLSEDELAAIVRDVEAEIDGVDVGQTAHSLVDQTASETDRGGFGFEGAAAIGISLNLMMFALEARDREWHRLVTDRIQQRIGNGDDEPTYEVIDADSVPESIDDWFGPDIWAWLPKDSQEQLHAAGTRFGRDEYPETIHAAFDAVGELLRHHLDGDFADVWPDGIERLEAELPIGSRAGVMTNLDFLWSQRQTSLENPSSIERDDALAILFVTKRTITELHEDLE